MPAHVYRHQRHRPVGLIAAVVVGMVVVGGGAYYFVGRKSPAHRPTPVVVSHLAPQLVGVVTEIGSGAAIGTGAAVEVVDLSHPAPALRRSVAVGTFPDAVAFAPNGKTAYVTNYGANTVTPIDLATGRAQPPIPAGNGPAGIAITPNGKTAYVTDAGSTPLGDTVTPIDLKERRALPPIRVGMGPQGIAITPDGRMAYVTDAGAIVKGQTGAIGHTVTPIDLSTNRALPSITVGNAPLAIAISSDGTTAFVSNNNSGSVSPISIAANTAGTPIPMSGAPGAIVAVPRRGRMVVANSGPIGANLTVISVASESVIGSFSSPKAPSSLAFSPDGKTLWVVSTVRHAIVPISFPSGTVHLANAISVPGGPFALGLTDAPGSTEKTLFAALPKTTAQKTTAQKTTAQKTTAATVSKRPPSNG